MRKTTFALVLITLLFSCNAQTEKVSQLITLSNGKIEIGILPAVGGRIVRASLVGKENILNSDSSQWNESPEKRPTLNPKAPFKAYNGSITWLSPQSQWWTNQDLLPDLKKNHSPWPPDPYLTMARYLITNQQPNQITLVSPESPYSKVQFTKTYRINDNSVTLTTVARNISKDTVSWGLWHNTRMNGWDVVFIQADSTALMKTTYMTYSNIRKPKLQYANGFYTYEAVKPEAGQTVYKSKSFFAVDQPLIAGFHQNQWLIIRSKPVDRKLIHPEEARVEIYVENSATPAKDLQELEIQFAYRKIAPQATIEATETWEILPGSGLTDKNKLLQELKEKLK